MIRLRVYPFAILLLIAFAHGHALSGESADGRHLVSDFDGGSLTLVQQRRGGTLTCVPDEDGDGQFMRFTISGSENVSWITLGRMPRDLRPFRHVRMRARVRGKPDTTIALRLRSKKGRVNITLPTLGASWTRLDLLIPEGAIEDEFEPGNVRNLRFVTSSQTGFTLDVDDIELCRGGDGWRYSPREMAAWGIDPAAPVYRIGDFDDPEHGGRFRADAGSASRYEKRNGKVSVSLRWEAKRPGDRAILALTRVPRDIRPYSKLRFRIRAKSNLRDGLLARFRTTKASIEHTVGAVSRKWRTVEIELPAMLERDEFDPEKVTEVQLVYTGGKPLELWLDDVEIVKGPGGWRTGEKKQLETVFGAKRASRVKRLETDHFVIFTDSAAARRKFPRALEAGHEFVANALGLEDVGGRLTVYIFQNATLYHGFCMRKGRTRASAERSAGHASGTYFATYYQAPDSPTVIHELTHAMFGRAAGRAGGSWLQEGVAVYVEERWQKRSAAETFAPCLRGGQFVPLAEFLTIPVLIAQNDASGGARTRDSLYAQAGAFFEFLIRGPYASTMKQALPELTAIDGAEKDLPDRFAKALGTTLAEIEKAWIEWGSQPPK